MSEESLVAEAEEGRRAARLLEGLAPLLDGLEREVLRVWREEAKTSELREEAWHRTKAIGWIRDELTKRINSGQYAEKRLNQD